MEDAGPKILFICAVILLKSIFSLVEGALAAARKTALRVRAEAGNRRAQQVLKTLEHSEAILFTIRLSTVFFGVLGGVAGGVWLVRPVARFVALTALPAPWATGVAVALVSLVVTLAAVILGEFIPKQCARAAPETILSMALPMIQFCACAARPFMALSGRVSALARLEPIAAPAITEEELRLFLDEGEKSGVVEQRERSMVEGVFYLGDRPVGAFMTHRSEIAWLDLTAPPGELRETAIRCRDQQYFPVAEGVLDEIAGVVSVQDILLALLSTEAGPADGTVPDAPVVPMLRSLMRPAHCVPETMPAIKAFEAFKKSGGAFLLVMDEYGGMAGVLPLWNLIEEIVGQLSASTPGEAAIHRQPDGSFLADGGVNIDDVGDVLGLESLQGEEHADYHTLAGFVLNLSGEIPHTGAYFTRSGYRFTVVDMDGNRINKVRITPAV